MVKPAKRRDVVAVLEDVGCSLLRSTGNHDVFICPCGEHRAPLPRHKEITAGVIRSIRQQLACLPEGWLK